MEAVVLKKMQCELCGSVDIMKVAPDVFQCQHCGCKYTLEQAKTLISGTVEITKGQAELERLLNNAEAQIRFGAYGKAEEIFEGLTNEYPGEHKVWVKYHECKRSALLGRYRVLDDVELVRMHEIRSNAMISAANEQERNEFLYGEEMFWQQFVMEDLSAQKPMINYLSLTDFVIAMVVSNGKSVDGWIDQRLWDYVAVRMKKEINSGRIKVYTGRGEPALLKNVIYQDTNALAFIMGLEKIHPVFAQIVQEGLNNAKAFNNAKFRMVHYYGSSRKMGGVDREYLWLPAGHEEINDLYVDMKWVYGPYMIGEEYYATNYNYQQKSFVTRTKRLDILDGVYAAMAENRKPENDLQEWNNNTFMCPFCSTENISDGLFGGRKCRVCKNPFPRFK